MSASVEKLKAARELVARPGGWTQKSWARSQETLNAVGVFSLRSTDGVCFCAEGALYAVGDSAGTPIHFLRVVVGDDVVSWNDDAGRTQAEVVAAFDRAIALAEVGS